MYKRKIPSFGTIFEIIANCVTQWPKNRKKGNENTCRCGCTTITSQAKITIFGKIFSIYIGEAFSPSILTISKNVVFIL